MVSARAMMGRNSTVLIGLYVHMDVRMNSTNFAVAEVPRAMLICVMWAAPAVVWLH